MNIVVRVAILLLAGTFCVAATSHSIIYLRPADALNLNPWQAEDLYSNEIAVNIFEGLVRFKKNSTTVEPCLATSWKATAGGTRWRFILRRGVASMTTALRRPRRPLLLPQPAGKAAARLPAAEFPVFFHHHRPQPATPYTVEIILDRPYAPFLIALADSAAFIQPARTQGRANTARSAPAPSASPAGRKATR